VEEEGVRWAEAERRGKRGHPRGEASSSEANGLSQAYKNLLV